MFDQKIADSCAVRHICSQHGKLCGPLCVAHSELQYQLTLADIPKRYWNLNGQPATTNAVVDLLAAENPIASKILRGWGADIVDNVSHGRGLYLYGKTTGTGKTTAVTALALDYIRATVSLALGDGTGVHKTLVKYVHVPTFLRLAKQIYESDALVSSRASAEIAKITEQIVSVPLLIFDDIGAEVPTESVRERLLSIIDQRWSNNLSTLYTSNLDLQALEMSLTARIRSRIEGSTFQIKFVGADKRRKTLDGIGR